MLIERLKTVIPLKNVIMCNKINMYNEFNLHVLHIPMMCWNRNPVAKFPKKANHGALPKSHMLRRIRKRLKTGR